STATSKFVQIDVQRIAGSVVDPVVMIFDSTGTNLLAFNDDGGGYPNSRLVFGTTAGVNYKIVVGSYGDVSTGGYQLTVNNYYPWIVYSPALTQVSLMQIEPMPLAVNTASVSSINANLLSGGGMAGTAATDAVFSQATNPVGVQGRPLSLRTGDNVGAQALT